MNKKSSVKIFSAIFAIVVLSVCAALAVSAAGAVVNVNSVTAHRGDTVTFNATLSESVTVGSGSLAVTYDQSVLEPTGGSCNVSGAMLVNFDVSKGKGAFAFSGTGTVSGDLFTATFRVKDAAAFGTTDVSMDITLKDGSNTVIALTNNSGKITVDCKHSFTKEDTTYIKSEATCTSPAIYYKSCVTCGAQGTDTFEYGSAKPHSYTREVMTDAYKKSGATCLEKAVYYYCCATCDAKGTTTYEGGEILPHSYTRKVVTDTYKKAAATCTEAAVYYYCCATCDDKGTTTYTDGAKLGHTGGTATCTAKAVCTRCGEEYGSTLGHIYTDEDATAAYLKSEATCVSPALYFKNCATCDKAGTATFKQGSTIPHSYVEKVDPAYLKSAASCTAKAVYYKSCSACGVKGSETFTAGGEPSHSYKTTWNSNSSSHWHECSKCGGKKDLTAHTPGAPATESTPQKCTVCNYEIAPASGHIHNYSNEWSKDENGHWHACAGCDVKKDEAGHTWDNACDTDCNDCGYIRSIAHIYSEEWKYDGEKHWHECVFCKDKVEMFAHVPSAEATETRDQVCTVCGFVIQEALGHTHNYDSIKKDETNHWKECACGEKTEVAQHTWNDGEITKEATADEEGIKTYTCTVCGHTKDESIAKIPQQSDEPADPEDLIVPEDPEDPEGAEDPEDEAGGCGSYISGAELMAVLLIAVMAICVKKKKTE